MTVILRDIAATETADGADAVALSYRMRAEASMWIAVRSWCARQSRPRDMTVAHSAPIYVVVNEDPTWKLEAVTTLVAHHRVQLPALPLRADRSTARSGDMEDHHDAGWAVATAARPPRFPRGGGRPPVPRTAGTVPALRLRGRQAGRDRRRPSSAPRDKRQPRRAGLVISGPRLAERLRRSSRVPSSPAAT